MNFHTIDLSHLPNGMYLYALIVDGKEVDTKRMIPIPLDCIYNAKTK